MLSVSPPISYSPDWQWRWWLPVPLYPYGQRRTLRREVIPDWVWVYEQIQGILYVVTPIRMTVLRLESGGLMVYAPVAPTPECLQLVNELVDRYGPVQHIILPTTSGLEHKVFVGPFAQAYPSATVYVAPGQWSFPLNLPLSWLGLPAQRTQLITENHPWGDRFEVAILDSIELGLGKFGEVALFDRRFQLLLVTDTAVSIPATPPEVVQLDPYPLLFHARDKASEAVVDTPDRRLIGWQRIVLFTFYFRPSMVEIDQTLAMLKSVRKAADRSPRAFWGLYPFRWQPHWQKSFDQTAHQGRLIVAPILQQLILNRQTEKTLAWVEKVAQWDFQQVISCHFQAPVMANGHDFRQAFDFLQGQSHLPAADLELLQNIDKLLCRSGILPSIESMGFDRVG
jgi:Domain of unknown function (DUF4336)